MQVFDLKTMPAYPYEEREKNIFYRQEEYRARITVLPPGGEIPESGWRLTPSSMSRRDLWKLRPIKRKWPLQKVNALLLSRLFFL